VRDTQDFGVSVNTTKFAVPEVLHDRGTAGIWHTIENSNTGMGRRYHRALKHQGRLKEAVDLVYGEVTGNAGPGNSLPDFQGAHTQRSRTDGLAVGFQDPDLPQSERIIEEMPVVLFLKVVRVGEVPAPQVDDDLPVFLKIGGGNSIFNQVQELRSFTTSGISRSRPARHSKALFSPESVSGAASILLRVEVLLEVDSGKAGGSTSDIVG